VEFKPWQHATPLMPWWHVWYKISFITEQRSSTFAEYWKHFVARLNDVHAFDYNSARSERIWMKFGALWVYCLELAQTDFGHDPRRSESESSSRFFVFFCHVTNARLYRFLVRQISQNLHTSRGSAMWWILSERNFQSLPTRGRFFPKCTFLISSRMTSDFRRR